MACKRSAVRSRLPPPTDRMYDAQAWRHHHAAGVDPECSGLGCRVLGNASWQRECTVLTLADTIGLRRIVCRRHQNPTVQQTKKTQTKEVKVGGSHRRPGPHRLEA